MTTAPIHLTLTHETETAEWHDDAGYLASGSGRIACATLAFALAGAAGIALFGTAANATLAIPVIILICIVGGFLATGLAIDRHGTLALAYLLTLPPIAGAYYAGLNVLVGAGVGAGVVFAALAAIPLVLLVRAKVAA